MDTSPSDAEKIRDALTGTNWRDLATAPWVTVEHLVLLLEALHHVKSFEQRALLRVSLAVTRRAFEALPPTDDADELRGRNLVDSGIIESVAWLESGDAARDTRDTGRMGKVTRWTLDRGKLNMETATDDVATALLFVYPVPSSVIMEAARAVGHASRAARKVLGEDRTCAALREHLVPLLVSQIAACEDAAREDAVRGALWRMNAPRAYFRSYVRFAGRKGGTPR